MRCAVTNTNAPATNETKALVAAANRPATTNARPPSVPQISIGAIVITNTAFSFSDRSIKPERQSVHPADERHAWPVFPPRQLQHADLNLRAKVDGVGPAAITGTLNPFSGTETNDLKISVKDMDLTPASPYAGKFAGYGIAEGKLNLDLSYQLVGKNLSPKTSSRWTSSILANKVDSPDATHLPVRLAVAIMKDRDGKIVLDVPIEGSLDDPKFRIGKVVTRAVVNILEKVATSPFSLLGADVWRRRRGTWLSGIRRAARN